MNKYLLNIIKFILFLGLAVLLLYFAFKGVEIKKLWNGILNANYVWVFLSVFISLFGFISRAIRWNIMIEPLGYKPKTTNSFYAVMIGYFANMAFPRIGEVTRCGSLNKTDKIPIDSLFGTVIVERIIDIFTLLSLTILVLILNFDVFGSFFKNEIFNPIIDKFSFSGFFWVIAIGSFVIILAALYLLRRKLKSFFLIKKIVAFIKGIVDGIKAITKIKKIGWFLILTVFIWITYLFQTYVGFFALESTRHLSLEVSLFVLVIGGIGMAAPVQGGFGAFHWIVSIGLMLFGLTQEEGLLFATLLHETQALFVILLGSLSLIMIFINIGVSKSIKQ